MKSHAMTFNQEKKSNTFVEKGNADPNPNKTDEHLETINEFTDTEADGNNDKKTLFWRNFGSCFLILLTVIAITILAILGIIYFPPKKNNRCSVIDFSKGNVDPGCTDIYNKKLKSVKLLRIYFQGQEHLSSDIDLQMSHTCFGNWSVQRMKNDKISIEMNTTHQTCNDAGIYLVQYQDSEKNIVYEQYKTVVVNANLSPIQAKTTPHLTKDGKSKRVLFEATMSTGCRHGTIAPVLMKGDNEFFVEKSSCTSRFNSRYGGNVTCITDIPESVWKSVDRVITELYPNNNLPSYIQPSTINTAETNTEEICEQVYLKYSEKGIINCKKLIDGPVALDIYHQSIFGNETFLIGLENGKYRVVANKRFELEATYGNLLNFTLTITNVHCDDQGVLKINFSDATVIYIKVRVQEVPQSCKDSRFYETKKSENFVLECSWCPGHNVSRVTVTHEAVHTFSNQDDIKRSYPIHIDMSGGQEHSNGIVTAVAQYGLLKVTIRESKTACYNNGIYKFKASSLSGQSMRIVNVTVRAPNSFFVDEMKVPSVFVEGRKANVTYEGFLGCFSSNVTVRAKNDNEVTPLKGVIEYDSVYAQTAKLTWQFNPAEAKHDKKKLSAEIIFNRSAGDNMKYSKETVLEVLNKTLCAVRTPTSEGCNVKHPTDANRFVQCDQGLTITGVQKCPYGLVFKASDVCAGSCNYPSF